MLKKKVEKRISRPKSENIALIKIGEQSHYKNANVAVQHSIFLMYHRAG
ncbi:MAG: hypothetical protein M3015_07330 [Bacteroidota bacterium]|nr:hypothetical protein [Bacteroidota bacterium]